MRLTFQTVVIGALVIFSNLFSAYISALKSFKILNFSPQKPKLYRSLPVSLPLLTGLCLLEDWVDLLYVSVDDEDIRADDELANVCEDRYQWLQKHCWHHKWMCYYDTEQRST
jgi:hypothetical protein